MEKKTSIVGPINPIAMSASHIAEALDVDRSTVWRWLQEGILPKPSIKVGRVVRWDRDAIAAFARGEVQA